MNNYNVTYKYC